MESTITIRYAEEKQISGILDLEKRWKLEKIDKDMNPYEADEIRRAVKDKRIIIAKKNELVVGFLFFEFRNKVSCELDAIYVDQKQRSLGIGHLLMQHFLNIDKVNKCEKIYLQADSIHEKKLMTFYKKYGFEKITTTMIRKKP